MTKRQAIDGAGAVVRFIKDRTAAHVFGLPGSSSVPVFHEIGASGLQFVPSLQENAAVAMADGYSRFRGPTAVLLYMLPGVATSLSNLYNAYRDESPLISIVSQLSSRSRGHMGAVGEADVAELVRPFTRYAREINHRGQLSESLLAAHRHAVGPPAGPTLLSVTEDVWSQAGDVELYDPSGPLSAQSSPGDVDALVKRLLSAERPLVIVGGQLRRSGGVADLEALVEALAIPVMYEPFWNDRLGISPNHPSNLGQLNERSSLAATADFVIALGCRFFNEIQPRTSPWFPEAFVGHVNADPLKVAGGRPAAWSAVADPATTARLLLETVRKQPLDAALLARRRARIAEARSRRGRRGTEYDDVANALADELDSAYVVDESVTASQPIVAKFRSARGARYVSTTGGSLGWGAGAAAGVALATGERVTCLLGDGAFFFGLHGLWPAALLSLPITYVVIDNGGFGSTQWYESEYLRVTGRPEGIFAVGSDFRSNRPSPVDVARGFGIEASDVANADELQECLKKPRSKPCLLRVKTQSSRS